MGSNLFFNNFENSMEQDLVESLIVESISIYGHSVYYCPRALVAKDDIYGEDPLSEYNSAHLIDLYIKSFDSYEGDGTFLSKFNLEIRDQVTFTLARRTFYNEVGMIENMDRPLEGDLVYSPMMKRMFVIKYVSNTSVFYQMGSLQTWDLVCEVWEYSSERFNTGIDEIDDIEARYTISEPDFGIASEDGEIFTDEDGYTILQDQFDHDEQLADTFADNKEIEEEGESIVDWTNRDPFSEEIEEE